jgi:hypothetical protein
MGQEQSKPTPQYWEGKVRSSRRRADSLDAEMEDSVVVEKSGYTYDGTTDPTLCEAISSNTT